MKNVDKSRNSRNMESRISKRAMTVHYRKKTSMVIAGFVLILLLVLLGNSIRVFASSGQKADYHKYYTSVQLEKGDSLWTLADEYNGEHVVSRNEYIDEVCRINQISEDTILHSGKSVVVPYYSVEIK